MFASLSIFRIYPCVNENGEKKGRKQCYARGTKPLVFRAVPRLGIKQSIGGYLPEILFHTGRENDVSGKYCISHFLSTFYIFSERCVVVCPFLNRILVLGRALPHLKARVSRSKIRKYTDLTFFASNLGNASADCLSGSTFLLSPPCQNPMQQATTERHATVRCLRNAPSL